MRIYVNAGLQVELQPLQYISNKRIGYLCVFLVTTEKVPTSKAMKPMSNYIFFTFSLSAYDRMKFECNAVDTVSALFSFSFSNQTKKTLWRILTSRLHRYLRIIIAVVMQCFQNFWLLSQIPVLLSNCCWPVTKHLHYSFSQDNPDSPHKLICRTNLNMLFMILTALTCSHF